MEKAEKTLDLKDLLFRGAFELGVSLSDEQISLFFVFLDTLKKWNKKINLTAILGDRDILIRHFLDSLIAVRFLSKSSRLLDMGSGAGFPGIPIKIAMPEIDVTLMESTKKKAVFLKHAIRTLGLIGIDVESSRAEDGAAKEKLGDRFDCVISRALTDIDDYLRLARPYLKEEGIIIAMKGPKGKRLAMELKAIRREYELHEVRIPFTDRKTSIVVFHVEQCGKPFL